MRFIIYRSGRARRRGDSVGPRGEGETTPVQSERFQRLRQRQDLPEQVHQRHTAQRVSSNPACPAA